MRNIIRIAALAFAFLVPGAANALTSRVSDVILLLSTSANSQTSAFLSNPGPAFVQGFFQFAAPFAADALIDIELDFIDGENNPAYFQQGDWAARASVQRGGGINGDGILSISYGNAANLAGTASAPTIATFDIGVPLLPNIWYMFRCEADFSTRTWRQCLLSGENVTKGWDLTAYDVAYPQPRPFDNRAITYFVGGSCSDGTACTNTAGVSTVSWTSISGGAINCGNDVPQFFNNFGVQSTVSAQPTSGPPTQVATYDSGTWYMANANSLFTIQCVQVTTEGACGVSFQSTGVADAHLP